MQGDIRRFTADEAMRMVEVGILGDDEHVQLLDGMLIETKQQSPVHSATTVQLGYLLREVYEEVATVCEQKPLTTDTYSLPEPDIMVVNRDFRDFELRHPKGEEAILVVELAWSTQDAKRRKASIYAAGGVEVYWLIDLAARKLELRTTPLDGGYQVTRILGEDDVVTLPESDVCWTVRELLPPSPARRP